MGETLLVALDQIHVYLEHDQYLRAGTQADHATPVGYDDFASSFNLQVVQMDTEGTPHRLATEGTGGRGPTISGPSPPLVLLVGD